MNNQFNNLFLDSILNKIKRKVFISYHHQNDESWVDSFSQLFSETYDLFIDRSLDEEIDSNNLQYVDRTIREDYITGTSITIVICGKDTWRRKCVDWEIHSTLDKDHALLGIILPNIQVWENNQWISKVPDRLYINIKSGYAHYIDWTTDPKILKTAIEVSISNSTTRVHTKNNSADKMTRNI